MSKLSGEITKKDCVEAIKYIQQHGDVPKVTRFRVVYDGKRYSAKSIMKIAYKLNSIPWTTGHTHVCEKKLKELGFEIRPEDNELYSITFAPDLEVPERYETKTTRIIRDSSIIRKLKGLYQNKCQVCMKQIKLKEGFYSEGHHLQPLGHDGPDVKSNILILCPNHHAEFDMGSIAISPETKLIEHIDTNDEFIGEEVLQKHSINQKYIEYHFNNIFS